MKVQICLLAAVLWLGAATTAFAQSAVAPQVVTSATSSGANVYQPVGNGSGTSTPMPVTLSGGSGATVTANQGTGGLSPWLFNLGQIGGTNVGVTNPLFIRPSDGTNPFLTSTNPGFNVLTTTGGTQAAIKAGSTAAAAGDTSLVVGLSPNSPLPAGTNSIGSLTTNPVAVTPTDRGGTIATGGTAQSIMALNTSRKGCWIQNPVNATEDLYGSTTSVSPTTTAGTPDDFDLGPGMSWSCAQNGQVIQAAVYVIAATTGHAIIAKEVQ